MERELLLLPTTAAPSSPPYDELQRADEIQEQQPENQIDQLYDESKEAAQRQGLLKRKRRRPAALIMDFAQTKIPAHTYRSWLQDTSDISSRRGKKKGISNVSSAMKMAQLMELPHLAFEDNHRGVGVSIENIPSGNYNLVEDLKANEVICLNAFKANEVIPMVTPGKSDDIRSIPNSASGQGNLEIDSGRSNQRRTSSRISSNGLELVAKKTDPSFNLSRLFENGPTTDPEALIETRPTQTQPPITKPLADKITDSIRMEMKSYFDAPGASKVQSLNKLAAGFTRKKAVMLFYQTWYLSFLLLMIPYE